MNNTSKRNVNPRLEQLLDICVDKREALEELLSFPVDSIASSVSDLKSFANQLKVAAREHSSFCHEGICALIKNASVSEADELRNTKKDKKVEVNSKITCINNELQILGSEDIISNISINSVVAQPGRAGSVLNDFPNDIYDVSLPVLTLPSCISNGSKISFSDICASAPPVTTSFQSVVPPFSLISSTGLNSIYVASGKTDSYASGICSPPDPILSASTHKKERFFTPSSSNFTHFHTPKPTFVSSSSATYPYDTEPASARTKHVSWDPSFPTVGSSFSAASFSNDLRYPPVSRLSFDETPVSMPSYFSNSRPSGPGTSTFAPPFLNPPVNQSQAPGFYQNQPAVVVNDTASLCIVKQQLFRKSTDLYAGEPHLYNSWITSLRNKTAGLNLSAQDQLLVLQAHSTGEPLKVVERRLAIGGLDPSLTLQETLSELQEEFGSSVRIANSLNVQVDSFPVIKSCHHVNKLKELLNLCEYINVNMTAATDLGLFNYAYGLRRIWLKLPDNLQNSWRSICDDYRVANQNQYPKFSIFVRFLAKKVREYSDPLLQRPSSTMDSKKREGIALKTNQSESQAQSDINDAKLPTSCLQSHAKSPTSTQVFLSEGPLDPPQGSLPSNSCPLHPNGKHSLTTCRRFAKLSNTDKINQLKQSRLCFLCFGGHIKSKCTSGIKCDKCGGNHNSLLHFESNNQRCEPSDSSVPQEMSLHTGSNAANQSKSCSKTLLVDVCVKGIPDRSIRCYAIVDEQSSSSFADPKLAELFGIKSPTVNYDLKTLAGSSTKICGTVLKNLRVKGVGENKSFALPPLYSNPFIPNCKSEVASPSIVSAHPHIRHLARKFPEFDDSADVLLLLGRDSGSCMLTRCYGNRTPFAHHTSLGWALVGTCVTPSTAESSESPSVLKVVSEHFHYSPCFNSEVKSALPELNIFAEARDDELQGFSRLDEEFLNKVCGSFQRNELGNIVLPLPFRKEDPVLPNNSNEVYCRTKSTLGRLAKDDNKLKKCLDVMHGYLSAGHVEIVPKDEVTPRRPGHCWWIPVFPVTHPRKHKVRIVFDSSAKYHGTSLNDQLLPGPDLGNKLRDVLFGFRVGNIGFSADVEAMFHNFHLQEKDRDYLRFYWYENNDHKRDICQFRAKVHIFGNNSSPTLACLGLRHAANSSQLPHVIDFVNNQFYVDDGMSSSDTVDQAVSILRDTREALSSYRIRLHKIVSSSKDVVNSFPESERSIRDSVNLEDNSVQSALGLIWNTDSDEIILRAELPDRPFTRRGVLATVNSVFDPLGISCPIILEGKQLQRKYLSLNAEQDKTLSWDDELPQEFEAEWLVWKRSLAELNGLSVPRCYKPINFGTPVLVELHAFCDASTEGTGAVVYVRTINNEKRHWVSFVCATSRITPKSAPSVPRLELCAALELSSIVANVADKIQIQPEHVYLYSDSMITLGYLKNKDRSFSRYVCRRVSLILKSYESSRWFFVPTADNPADIASRVQTVQSLKSSCWLKGPEFLWEGCYPDSEVSEVDLPESKEVQICLKATCNSDFWLASLLDRCSTYAKVIAVVHLISVFGRKWLESSQQSLGKSLPSREPPNTEDAHNLLVIHEQRRYLQDILNTEADSKYSSLCPFTDSLGIIRVGGRLRLSTLEYSNKYPILLPKDSRLSHLLILHFHKKSLHQGRCITLSAIREAGYFIHRASSTIRKIIAQCFVCKRLRQPLSHQMMSDLPKDRIEAAPPFQNTGMDIFGPYAVSDGITTRRRTADKKCWAVIFTCLISRATHIEPLPSLDTTAMNNALRRFFCVRGNCRILRSDQGTSFIGAVNADSTISFADLSRTANDHGCLWELTPPKASHFGGIWERQIQTVKNILKSCLLQLGTRTLSRDELYTFLQECTAILNNTPLWEYSSDPNDPRPLTPSMLLTLRSDTPAYSEPYSERDLLAYGTKRWRRVQYLSDQFWHRWRTDYLQTLQKRGKWIHPSRSYRPGDVVLLRERSCKRYQWPLAKVLTVKISSDGLVRSVTLLTSSRNSTGTRQLERPVTEISLLVPANE